MHAQSRYAQLTRPAGASTYSSHKDFGDVLHFVTPVVLLLTLGSAATRNRVDVIQSIALIVLFELQLALADLKHPDAGAFHPVNGVLILAVAFSLLRRDVQAVRGQMVGSTSSSDE